MILRGKKARDKIISGVDEIADTVVTTLGPRGRNVGLGKFWIDPVVVHDGVSVAKEIFLEDKFEDFAAQLIRQAASKTNDRAGDGTTTTTLLAQEMIRDGMKLVNEGVNPMSMKKGMEIAKDIIVEKIREATIPVETKEKIVQVATISSQSENLGKVIADAVWKVGKSGAVDVEESGKYGIDYEIKEGMEFEKGLTSPQFATNDKGVAELGNPHILLLDYPIIDANELIGYLGKIGEPKSTVSILILADNIDQNSLNSLLVNKAEGKIAPLFIQSPGFAERRKEYLQDIAALTGATVVSKERGMNLSNVGDEVLGRSAKVTSDSKNTRIVDGLGTKKIIDLRIESIQTQIEEAESDFDKKIHRERIAKLDAGCAVIKVGGFTEVEMKDTKERVIDAVGATKAAFSNGIVYGGGKLLLEISDYLATPDIDFQSTDEADGYWIVCGALKAPFVRLLEHAGIEFDLENGPLADGEGINVETGENVDLIEAGIIDPSEVVISTVVNAISVAAMLITCDAIVVDIENPLEKQNKLNI